MRLARVWRNRCAAMCFGQFNSPPRTTLPGAQYGRCWRWSLTAEREEHSVRKKTLCVAREHLGPNADNWQSRFQPRAAAEGDHTVGLLCLGSGFHPNASGCLPSSSKRTSLAHKMPQSRQQEQDRIITAPHGSRPIRRIRNAVNLLGPTVSFQRDTGLGPPASPVGIAAVRSWRISPCAWAPIKKTAT